MLRETDDDTDCEADGEVECEGVIVSDGEPEIEGVLLDREIDGVFVFVGLTLSDADGDDDVLGVGLLVGDFMETVDESVCVSDIVLDTDFDADTEGEGELVTLKLADLLPLRLVDGDTLEDWLTVAVGVTLGVLVGETESLGESEVLGVPEPVGVNEIEPDIDIDMLPDSVVDFDGVVEKEPDVETDDVGVFVFVGE